MAVAGVICEYNPFHKGHEYHLAETRKGLGPDGGIVCVMSGNFVQRGECAILDKWSRAKMALSGGADLVLELPTVWAAASAEPFARGAVESLAATGVVDVLSFGSEAGELEPLRAAADCLDSEAYRTALGECLSAGVSFAVAREKAARAVIGAAAACLATPNNNLAVEYLRALPPHMTAMTVKRVGVAHDGGISGEYASASAIREIMRKRGEGAGLLHCERAVLARLRTMTAEDFAALPDSGASEGLPARLVRAAGEAVSLEEFYALAKTKRYAHARIRRLALWAFLGLTAADRPAHVPYVRVLGMNGRGRELLGKMKKTCSLPILTKPAHAKKLEGEGRTLFEWEARCTDLYGLCTPVPQTSGLEWTTNPVIAYSM